VFAGKTVDDDKILPGSQPDDDRSVFRGDLPKQNVERKNGR